MSKKLRYRSRSLALRERKDGALADQHIDGHVENLRF